REGVADRLGEVAGLDGPAARIDGADEAVGGGEPDPSAPVGQRRDDLIAGGHQRAEVVGAFQRERGTCRPARLADDPDLIVGGGNDGAVTLVEVEVTAAGELRERV